MNTILNIVRKDLRHASVGMAGWCVLQLVLNITVLWIERRWGADFSPASAIVAPLVLLVNAVIACLFAARFICEDPPLLGEGTWRTLPVRCVQMATAKLLASLLCAIVPTLLALLPCLLWLGCGPGLILRSLLLASGVQAGACILACGLSILAGRGMLNTVLQILGALGLAYVFLMVSVYSSIRPEASPWETGDPFALSRYVVGYTVAGLGGLATLFVFYVSGRRLRALAVFAATVALSLTTLLTWKWRLLEPASVTLSVGEVTMEQLSASVRRVAPVKDIPEGCRLIVYSCTGTVGLGNLREKAVLLSSAVRDQQGGTVLYFNMYKPGSGDFLGGSGDLYAFPPGVSLADFPKGFSEVAKVSARYEPGLQDQVLLRPSLDLVVHGGLFRRRETARFLLSEKRVHAEGGLFAVHDEAVDLGENRKGLLISCYQVAGGSPRVRSYVHGRREGGESDPSKLYQDNGYARRDTSLSIGMLMRRSVVWEYPAPSVDLSKFEYVEHSDPLVGTVLIPVTAPECRFTAKAVSPERLEEWQRSKLRRVGARINWAP